MQTLGIQGISKSQVSEMAKSLDEQVEAFRSRPLDGGPYTYLWVDALAIKGREAGADREPGHIDRHGSQRRWPQRDPACRRHHPGDGAGWLSFFRQMNARGLSGVELVISDSHEGLKAAIAATLPGASWQRCRTHFMRNLLTRVPKGTQDVVASMVRSIFAQPDAETTRAQHRRVADQLYEQFFHAAELLDATRRRHVRVGCINGQSSGIQRRHLEGGSTLQGFDRRTKCRQTPTQPGCRGNALCAWAS